MPGSVETTPASHGKILAVAAPTPTECSRMGARSPFPTSGSCLAAGRWLSNAPGRELRRSARCQTGLTVAGEMARRALKPPPRPYLVTAYWCGRTATREPDGPPGPASRRHRRRAPRWRQVGGATLAALEMGRRGRRGTCGRGGPCWRERAECAGPAAGFKLNGGPSPVHRVGGLLPPRSLNSRDFRWDTAWSESDVHEDKLEAAHVFSLGGGDSWVVGIRGLLHPPHICALLQFLEVPQKHWLPAVEGTVLASVDAFYFLHRVRFGGLPKGGLLETGLGHTELGEDTSDSSELDESRMVRGRCKRGSSWSHGVGSTSQRGSKRPKGSDQTYVSTAWTDKL